MHVRYTQVTTDNPVGHEYSYAPVISCDTAAFVAKVKIAANTTVVRLSRAIVYEKLEGNIQTGAKKTLHQKAHSRT
jgi:hypothetical protein